MVNGVDDTPATVECMLYMLQYGEIMMSRAAHFQHVYIDFDEEHCSYTSSAEEV